jgi:hypothetical protein
MQNSTWISDLLKENVLTPSDKRDAKLIQTLLYPSKRRRKLKKTISYSDDPHKRKK